MKTINIEIVKSSYIRLIDGVFSSKVIQKRNMYDIAVEYRTEAMGYFKALLDLGFISEDEYNKFSDYTYELIYERWN